jgi:heterodisulfide reductase subunit C
MLFSDQNMDCHRCHGCGLCVMVCPAWHQRSDVRCTPNGYARVMQCGMEPELRDVFSCIMCGACTSICPQQINLLNVFSGLRKKLIHHQDMQKIKARLSQDLHERQSLAANISNTAAAILLPGKALREQPETLNRVVELLRHQDNAIALSDDDGTDIVHALEMGIEIPGDRQQGFIDSLRHAKEIIVSDGLLKLVLQQWLPNVKVQSTGQVLSLLPHLRQQIQPDDLYVIESRSYNTDFERAVAFYDRLQQQQGCQLNLDLHRLAIPTGGVGQDARGHDHEFNSRKQAEWVVTGRKINRIIVESIEDGIQLAALNQYPVIHISELAGAG